MIVKTKIRKFTGKLDDFGIRIDNNGNRDNSEGNLQKKNLRAYLKGAKKFKFHGDTYNTSEAWI